MLISPKSELRDLQGADILLPTGNIILPEDVRMLILSITFTANNPDLIIPCDIGIEIFNSNNNCIYAVPVWSNLLAPQVVRVMLNPNRMNEFSKLNTIVSNLPYPLIIENGYIIFTWIPFNAGCTITDIIIHYISL